MSYPRWWRKAASKRFGFLEPDEATMAKLSTVRKATVEVVDMVSEGDREVPDPWNVKISSGLPSLSKTVTKPAREKARRRRPDDDDDSSASSSDTSDDERASSRARRERAQSHVTTAPTAESQNRVREEAIGVFNPEQHDPKKTEMVVVQNRVVYTDVYLFCEHVRVFERYGEDCLQDYYMSMIGAGAVGWLMGELSTEQRKRLLNSPIHKFCHKLTERFKRPDAEISEDLQAGKYTLSLAADGLSLTQWIQRKASYTKQLGIMRERHIIQAIFPLIDNEISRLLQAPHKKTTLANFVRECEERRSTIEGRIRQQRSRQSNDRNDRARDNQDRCPGDGRLGLNFFA